MYIYSAATCQRPARGKAIAEAGFPVILYEDFEVLSFSGFLPCHVDGILAGFEYYAMSVSSEEISELALPSQMDFSVLFCIGSAPLEMTTALVASSVLASISGGFLVDPQERTVIHTRDAIHWASSRL
ncbi:hypothetical protein J2S30_000684 [Herbaspirillum rubrisubalbicans]|uniref:hypothetical protein n=1 Tax=Herbaspirillum rubrisubalbicans TaxID=80842 RepID=UPI0020A00FA8|nr:hypothetical protein [Herbaspirillum rubrisubalbicans]MCP1572305.1 hypothetical protein [Herbaspirillum rubrisubalbicans]